MTDKIIKTILVGAIVTGVGIAITEFIFLHRSYERRKNMKLRKKENVVRENYEKGTAAKETNIRTTIPESADIHDIVEQVKHVGNVPRSSMTKLERDELVSRIKGMSKEELEIVVDCLPVEMCLNRIAKEIDKAQTFEKRVTEAINAFEHKIK